MRRNLRQNKRDKSIAQGMVEFTLTIPVFLLLAFGLIEFGRLMFVYIAVTTASREAVRYGSAVGDNGAGVLRYMDCAGMKNAAKAIGQFAGITDGDIIISYDTVNSGTPSCPGVVETDIEWGDRVEVTITATFNVGGTVPFIDLPPVPITSTARRTIMKGAQIVKQAEDPLVTPPPSNPNLKPIYITSVPMSTIGNKCIDIKFTWSPNGAWDQDVTSYYLKEIGGAIDGPLAPDIPITGSTVYFSNFSLLNGDAETFRLYAELDPDISKTLTFTLYCNNGVLSKVGS